MIQFERVGNKVVVKDSIRKQINDLKASFPQALQGKIDEITGLEKQLNERKGKQ